MNKYNQTLAAKMFEEGYSTRNVACVLGCSQAYASTLRKRLRFSGKTMKTEVYYIGGPIHHLLRMEAAKRNQFPGPFLNNLLRIIISDNLLTAILDDEKVPQMARIPLTSPHICDIIGPKIGDQTQ